MFDATRKHIVLLFIGLVAVLVACTPTTRHGVLKTLFDGVPPQSNSTEMIVSQDTIGQVDSTRILALETANYISKTYYHDPFLKKNCGSCHNQQQMGKLVAEEPELCFQCHDRNIESHSVKHGPAGAGFCTSCHQPHQSQSRKLLLAEGNSLCFTCHSDNLFQESKIHQSMKGRDKCVDCHNPHSSENIFMLQDGTCNKCHNEKNNEYSFLHGPVAGNYCSVCHETHASENEDLLINAGLDLCINCHSSATLFMNPEHQGENNEDCMACHNPHGGENKFLLK